MNPQTASQIAHKWLSLAGVIQPPLDRVATTLANVLPEPDAWECTRDGELVILDRKALWVGTATPSETSDLEDLRIERFDLRSVRATFTQRYSRASPGTNPEWRFAIGDKEELIFRAAAPGDEPIVFGSRVAEALGS